MFNGVNDSSNGNPDLHLLREKYGISNNSIIILSIARLDSNKRINLLLDAFSLIKQEVTLIIVGEGPELEHLKKQATSINTGNKIVFVKPLPHDQVIELYQLCNVFTLPSKLEGMPLVLIEALSFGKTVVTNPAPVKKFILDKFGVFSNVEDPKEYSTSLIDAMSNKIDINSEEFIQHMNKFQWSIISQQYIETFHEVLSERKHAK
jgi:glycosyltransferase involved in cell wall biosynthesis